MSWIFSAEIDSIHKYVVTSNKLWTIRAGSALLDKFNREVEKEPVHKGKLQYSKGGVVKAEFENRVDAEIYGKTLQKKLRDMTEIANISWGVAEIIKGDKNAAHTESIHELQKKKNYGLPAATIVSNPFLHKCSICKKYPAVKKIVKSGEEYIICSACNKKNLNLESIPIYKEIKDAKHHDDLESLAGDDYLALVCSDGNNMGQHIRGIPFDELGVFASQIDKATKDAFKKAANETFPLNYTKYPFEIIILGGDDMAVIMPARYAFEFVRKYTELFSNNTGGKYTVSSGIAIAKKTFPVSNMLDVAEQLQKNAKKLTRQNAQQEIAAVDFEVITESLSENISDRRKSLTMNRFVATGRPYAFGGDRSFQFSELIETCKSFKESGVGRTAIHSFYDIFSKEVSLEKAKIEMKIKLAKLPIKDKYKQENYYFIEHAVNILDIAEIYDFI